MPMISRMTEAEEKLADIIWSNEPIASKDLISICSQKLDWKKSTTYTLLKRLEDKKIFKNEKSVITSLVTKNEYLAQQGCKFIDTEFGGSLPAFISAFTKKRKLTKTDIISIKEMIKNFEEIE